jgi:hypothetical protein
VKVTLATAQGNTYTHVMADGREADHKELLAA